jgi:hypothetical protein
MKTTFGKRVEDARDQRDHDWYSEHGDRFGFFFMRKDPTGPMLKILVTEGDEEHPWEHVSVSLANRCPTWDEMCWVKSLFWEDDETVCQFHPPKSEYVNFHQYCLHLWKPTKEVLQLPPYYLVGPKNVQAVV